MPTIATFCEGDTVEPPDATTSLDGIEISISSDSPLVASFPISTTT